MARPPSLRSWHLLLLLAIAGSAWASACSGGGASDGATSTTGTSSGGGIGGAGSAAGGAGGGFAQGTGGSSQAFDVQPAALQTIQVTAGQSTPTVTYTATLNAAPVNAGWSVDQGAIGSVTAGPASSTVFTPTGKVGGLVDVIAGVNMQTVKRQVMVQLTATQDGPNGSVEEQQQIATSVGQLSQGGGIGGVGGEGLGAAVNDPTLVAALGAPVGDGSAQSLVFLYPYDKTVWPRGMLAPLLQWSSTLGGVDAIRIDLATTSGSFTWSGTFAKPPILSQTGKPFIRHPIPQDVWNMATNSASGPSDPLVVKLTVAKGGMAYGPIVETWKVAPAHLAGTVYYNSYGTLLVANSFERQYNNGPQFGAAVLAIQGGSTAPSVVAGTASPLGSGAGCRVCHVVSADGSRLIAQHGDIYSRTSAYDLKNMNAESVLNGYDNLFGWAGLSPDGKLALTNAADLAASAPASQLYTFPPVSATPLPVTGIPADLRAGAPAFSPDGRHVAFDFLGGTIDMTTGNGTQLVALDFDAATSAFSNLKVLATMPSGKRAGFPSFLPTNDAVAFHYQIVPSNHRYNTWHGAKAQIWWSDVATGTATVYNALNGLDANGMTSYLPTGPNNHADDVELNYEPTVNPIVSGGYAWVIFTSRRLYGNVATTDPWQSDPRSYDATNIDNTTTKKLWVAAIDLSAPPGTDPSHPAFYLPAQELLAGNARGFWVLDPCKPDGQSCETGDQCCNGFCEPNGMGGALICSNIPPAGCSGVQEKCATASDCCDATNLCINGFCAQNIPN